MGGGGDCLDVDPWVIVSDCAEKSHLIKAAREVNDYKTKWVIEKIKLQWKEKNKPNIDDLRESPAVKVVKRLQEESYHVLPMEPN